MIINTREFENYEVCQIALFKIYNKIQMALCFGHAHNNKDVTFLNKMLLKWASVKN